MHLAALIDLEWQLQRDLERPLDELRARDREIGRRVLETLDVTAVEAREAVRRDRRFRERLTAAWLREVVPHGGPGGTVERAFSGLGLVLLAAGAVVGFGTARTLLAYDGTRPVNVLWFAGVFFLLQIVLLVLLAFFALWRRRAPGAILGTIERLALSSRLGRLFGTRRDDLVDLVAVLRGRSPELATIERWRLFGLGQRFGIAFNVAALATCLYLVVFSDLVFGWSTTLDVDAEELHTAVTAVSAPWSVVWPDAVPSRELVAASQWERMPGRFVGIDDAEQARRLAARWWQFLVAGLCVYGLAPRLLAFGLARWRIARVARRLPFDDARYQQLHDRLLPAPAWRTADPDLVRGDAPHPSEHPVEVDHSAAPTWVVAWGRLAADPDIRAADVVRRRFACEVPRALPAGTLDLADDAATLQELAAARPERVAVLFDASQQPTRDVLTFLRDLRSRIGGRVPVAVGLVAETGDGAGDPDGVMTEAWRRSLATLGDTHLWLESFGAGARA